MKSAPEDTYEPCSVCGAVKYGNATCRECVSHWVEYGIKREDVDRLLAAIGDRPPDPPVGPDEVREFIARVEGVQS